MQPDPPVAESAVWVGVSRQVLVTFSTPIQDVPLDLANWVLRHAGGDKSPGSASVDGNVITLQFTATFGPFEIGYDPPPFDVVAEPPNGLPAAAFVLPV